MGMVRIDPEEDVWTRPYDPEGKLFAQASQAFSNRMGVIIRYSGLTFEEALSGQPVEVPAEMALQVKTAIRAAMSISRIEQLSNDLIALQKPEDVGLLKTAFAEVFFSGILHKIIDPAVLAEMDANRLRQARIEKQVEDAKLAGKRSASKRQAVWLPAAQAFAQIRKSKPNLTNARAIEREMRRRYSSIWLGTEYPPDERSPLYRHILRWLREERIVAANDVPRHDGMSAP